MILVGGCQCGAVVRVSGYTEPGQEDLVVGQAASSWYPASYPCPVCGELTKILTSADPASKFIDLTPLEAFVAWTGAGLPWESECSPTFVKQLFETGKVKTAHTGLIPGSTRCVVERLVFEDGTELFLGASTYGATAYRVRRPHSYTKEAL